MREESHISEIVHLVGPMPRQLKYNMWTSNHSIFFIWTIILIYNPKAVWNFLNNVNISSFQYVNYKIFCLLLNISPQGKVLREMS